jgi:hypothetical protein
MAVATRQSQHASHDDGCQIGHVLAALLGGARAFHDELRPLGESN